MYLTGRAALLLAVCLAAGCTNMQVRTPAAEARVAPTKDHHAEGIVTFLQKGDNVLVEARITGLTPGLHGFHIHEKGDCSAPDASSAGAHFNPHKSSHGGHLGGDRHSGDLGNLLADQNGTALYKAELSGLNLGTGDDSIVGRSVVVHQNADDLYTQPSGNSGPRIGCGLISLRPDKWFHTPK